MRYVTFDLQKIAYFEVFWSRWNFIFPVDWILELNLLFLWTKKLPKSLTIILVPYLLSYHHPNLSYAALRNPTPYSKICLFNSCWTEILILMHYLPISNGFYYSYFGYGHSIETFEGARVIVLSPNSVHEDNFITLGVYFGGEGQQLWTYVIWI